jgi:hypothetical protein
MNRQDLVYVQYMVNIVHIRTLNLHNIFLVIHRHPNHNHHDVDSDIFDGGIIHCGEVVKYIILNE